MVDDAINHQARQSLDALGAALKAGDEAALAMAITALGTQDQATQQQVLRHKDADGQTVLLQLVRAKHPTAALSLMRQMPAEELRWQLEQSVAVLDPRHGIPRQRHLIYFMAKTEGMQEAAIYALTHDASSHKPYKDTRGKESLPIREYIYDATEEDALAMVQRVKPDLTLQCKGQPLHWAIEAHKVTLARQLLADGAPVNGKGVYGATPLYLALRHDMFDLAKELMTTYHAAIDGKVPEGGSIFQMACFSGEPELIEVSYSRPRAFAVHTGDTAHGSATRSSYVADMLDEIERRMLLPALLLEASPDPSRLGDAEYVKSIPFVKHGALGLNMLTLNDWLREALFDAPVYADPDWLVKQKLERPSRLARSWHSHAVVFPDALIPLQVDPATEWHPMWLGRYQMAQGELAQAPEDTPARYDHQFVASNGYIVTPITIHRDLVQESNDLSHCVGDGGFTPKCCEGTTHILGIRKPDGTPVTTAEIKFDKDDDDQITHISVIQHKGRSNRSAIDVDSQAVTALNECVDQVISGALPLNLEWGEKSTSITYGKRTPLNEIGYVPSWDHVQQVFQEYKRDTRRAARSVEMVGDQEHVVYMDQQMGVDGQVRAERTEDGYRHRQHLIDERFDMPQHQDAQGRVIRHRDMDVRSWLRATGLMDKMHTLIAEKPAEFGLDAAQLAQLEARWESDAKEPIRGETPPPISVDQTRDWTRENAASLHIHAVASHSLVTPRMRGMARANEAGASA